MKEPEYYELKKWLDDRHICTLTLDYYPTGVDTAETDWVLTSTDGQSRRIGSNVANALLEVRTDHISVVRLKGKYVKEVEEWAKYVKKEARDLAEYERLKKKFS